MTYKKCKMNWFGFVFVLIFTVNDYSAQDIFDTVEAVVGHSAELPCNVTAEVENDKLNILAWYRNGSATAFYSSNDLRGGDYVDGALAEPSDRYRLVSGDDGLDRLQVVQVVPSDAGLYHCLADFAASPAHKTFVQLNIIEPPRHLWVVHENGTQLAKASAGVNVSQNIGPYYVGDTVHLFCVAMGGKPQASLSWRMEARLLKDTYTPISEHRVRSDIMYGPLRAEDYGRVLSCEAKNNNVTSPLSIDVIIDMFLPPELVYLRAEGDASGRVKAGETLGLQCRVLGSRPPPPIVWSVGDIQLDHLEQNVTVKESQRLVVSDVQLSIDRKYDEASVTCCALARSRGEDSFICSDKFPLTVLYPPVLEVVVEFDLDDNNTIVVPKGTDIRMSCIFRANPAVYQLVWFHEDDIWGGREDNSHVVQSYLELPSVSAADGGEYICAATNEEGSSYSEAVWVNVIYPPYCENETIVEYNIGESESVNISCAVNAYPPPTSYRWAVVNATVNLTSLSNYEHVTLETEDNVLLYDRPNSTTNSTIFCWGLNEVDIKGQTHTPCTFLITDETAPQPLTDCKAAQDLAGDIVVKCAKGYDGGLAQKFKLIVKDKDSEENYLSITTTEPKFMITKPLQKHFKFVISAFNEKGESKPVEIMQDDIVDVSKVSMSAVSNITTFTMALCGGVLLVALAACGLVLCARERDVPGAGAGTDAPLFAYNTEESNCETYHGSEDESECNVRRTESFRRAMARYPSRGFDVQRTSSFHSAKYMDAAAEPDSQRCQDALRYNACRVHSLQNINRKREMDALCDHLVLHLPPEANYNVPRPMNTFYTMPRKSRQRLQKEISDEASEITATSDGFSLPPPPDEFGTYRAATRIKDIPPKTTPTYTTIKRNNSGKEQARQQYSNVVSPMNTVGIPSGSGSGTHNTLYSYSDDDHHQAHRQVMTNPFDEDDSS